MFESLMAFVFIKNIAELNIPFLLTWRGPTVLKMQVKQEQLDWETLKVDTQKEPMQYLVLEVC